MNFEKVFEYGKEVLKRKSYLLMFVYVLLSGVYLRNNEFINIAIWLRKGVINIIPLNIIESVNIIIGSIYRCFHNNFLIFTIIPFTVVCIHDRWFFKEKLWIRTGVIKLISFMWFGGYVIKEMVSFLCTANVQIHGWQSWISVLLNGFVIVIIVWDRLFR